MQFSAALLSILPAAMAAPALLERDANEYTGFGLITSRSGSNVHLLTVTAADYAFNINKGTVTYCPSPAVQDCDAFSTTTQLSCSSDDGSATTCGMSVSVPGGQQLYVNPQDGRLQYTQAHSANKPEGAFVSEFSYTKQAEEGRVGTFTFNGGGASGWFVCPDGQTGDQPAYSIVADVEGVDVSGCQGVGLVTAGSNATAWEYN